MRIVPYIGPTDAKIYLVGEAPGVEEETRGEPFVGGSGRILDKMLMDVGISRGECRIANVMRVRPPNNDFSHFYTDRRFTHPTPELEEGRQFLRDDIKRCKPNVVVALGNEALAALFNHRGVTDWRGSILWHHRLSVKVIPTVHPAMVMRQWDYAPLVLFDLRRVLEESKTPTHSPTHRDFTLAPPFEQVMREMERLRKCKRIAFDVETVGTAMSCIAFADSPFSAISIPFTFSKGTNSINVWTLEEEYAILQKIKELMEDEKVEKIAQNAQFDCIILLINPPGIKVRGLVVDTMCAHHTVYPELPKGLDVLCSIYTRQPYYKHMSSSGNDVEFWKYNCTDACVTYESAIAIEKEMREFTTHEFYYRIVHPLIPILMEMQMRGVRVNQQVRLEGAAQCTREVAEAQAKLNELVGRDVNVMSPKQLKQLLYVDMHLPPRISRMSGKETTDEEALISLSHRYPSGMFDLILSIRKNRKLLGTYLTDEGERIRCSYVIGGTKTGRLSSRESLFGGGTNLQNIPRGVCRRMFIPDEGKVFIESDLSQAEARVVAYLSGEDKLIELFEKGGDIHRQVAGWIYGKDTESVRKEERELSKRLVHASNYGIGTRTFAHHSGVSEGEARMLLQKYFDTFPHIKAWQLSIQAQLGKRRVMETPMGRKRMFFGRWGDQLFREAYSYVPQSTVADVLNYALIRFHNIQKEKEWHRAEVMLQVHDSFVVQCDVGTERLVIEEMRKAFNIPLTVGKYRFVIPVEIKMGRNWDEMEGISEQQKQ